MNLAVDQYLEKFEKWKAEIQELRRISLDCKLTEEFKWKQACYSFQNKNVVIIAPLKDYCALSFFKGVLLKDTHSLLVRPGENSQNGRLLKFTSLKEILDKEEILKQYIFEAIEVEKAGIKVPKSKSEPLIPELVEILNIDTELKTAFSILTPGKQRGYNLYFAQAKQSKTRISRIKKCKQKILNGKGFYDCTCGLSKRYPRCDGSHKQIQT